MAGPEVVIGWADRDALCREPSTILAEGTERRRSGSEASEDEWLHVIRGELQARESDPGLCRKYAVSTDLHHTWLDGHGHLLTDTQTGEVTRTLTIAGRT